MLIILGDFYSPQGNFYFLLLRYIYRSYQFIDNSYVLYSLPVYSIRLADAYLIYKMFRISGVSSTTSISLSLYHLNLYTFPSLHMSSIYLKTSSFYLFYHTKYVSCCHSLNLFLTFGNYF